jgi:hypothetical protein
MLLSVDAAGNKVLEPGESVVIAPSWLNPSDASGALTATSTATSSDLTLSPNSAGYGSIGEGPTKQCTSCFGATAGTSRPSTHWDTTITEGPVTTPSGVTPAKTWIVHIGASFSDVPVSNIFYQNVEALIHNGVTLGCEVGKYGPAGNVARDQMAAFIARAKLGGDANVPVSGVIGAQSYNCVAGVNGSSLFTDVAATDSFCKHVHYVKSINVTLGCTSATQYCPSDSTTRGQMARFIARAMVAPNGDAGVPASFNNPTLSRSYDCSDGLPNHFGDVPDTSDVCKQVHFIWANGVADGNQAGQYRSDDLVTREQMAKFLSNAFSLQLYKP